MLLPLLLPFRCCLFGCCFAACLESRSLSLLLPLYNCTTFDFLALSFVSLTDVISFFDFHFPLFSCQRFRPVKMAVFFLTGVKTFLLNLQRDCFSLWSPWKLIFYLLITIDPESIVPKLASWLGILEFQEQSSILFIQTSWHHCQKSDFTGILLPTI